MMCVGSAHYAVLANGISMSEITPTRGIRQRDPILPFLFLICVEALCSLMTRADRVGVLTGVATSKTVPRLNYLFFANDNLLFCRANVCH